MTVDAELQPNLKSLNTALRNILSFRTVSSGALPPWYGRVLSNVLLLIGEDKVEYVSGTIDSGAHSVKVVVFTPELVIRVDVADWEVDLATLSATATPRASLIGIQVESDEGVFSDDVFSAWPTRIRLALSYADEVESLRVPLEREMNGDQLGPLRKLLADLLHDLKRSS
ncbi:MAG: hypothetical protein JWQ39_617 [Glaciihabitans sp.]|jgi:hypothetical protein|nr:hypothetical protein [Glaciihabitans sp.]